MKQNAKKLADIYVLSSVFIGPAIPIIGYSASPGGGDCFDPAWGRRSFSEINAIMLQYQTGMKIAASIFLGLGSALLIYLLIWLTKHPTDEGKYGLRVLLLFVMLAGYGLVFMLANGPACGVFD
jgi:hypothetical protein